MMSHLLSYWMPILASAVAIFFLSSIIHMAMPWHKSDYLSIPNEAEALAAFRSLAIPKGDYMLPRATSMDEHRSPEFQKKLTDGPRIILTSLGPWNGSMAGQLGSWFIFSLVVSGFAACIADGAMGGTFDRHAAFHFTALTSFACYSFALWPMTIWYGRKLSTTIKSTIDGLIYGLVTGAIFMYLSPQ